MLCRRSRFIASAADKACGPAVSVPNIANNRRGEPSHLSVCVEFKVPRFKEDQLDPFSARDAGLQIQFARPALRRVAVVQVTLAGRRSFAMTTSSQPEGTM